MVKKVKLYIDSKYAYVDGVKVEIDPGKNTSIVIKNGRTMVPVAFVAKTFDVEVGWVAYPRGGIVKFYSRLCKSQLAETIHLLQVIKHLQEKHLIHL